MHEVIVYVDRSDILPGKAAEVRQAINDLVAFVDAREPQLLTYGFYLNEEETEMTLVSVHPDSASLEFHIDVASDAFQPFSSLIRLRSIEVYGDPSGTVLEQLRGKARRLGGNENVYVQRLQGGFMRMPRPARAGTADR